MTTLDRRLPPGFLEEALRADAQTGLTAEPKSLPPKWFYDAQGSALFDKITELPEYYPTRAEREILRASAAEIAAQTGARTLIELGSGSSDKTRLLLDALRDAGTLRCYVPVDVSEPALAAAGKALSAEYPGLDVRAVVSDFEERLGFPADAEAPAPRLVAFLGSTIGNLEPGQRAVVPTGIAIALPDGYAAFIHPRSGLAARHGVTLVNAPGTVDAGYRGEIRVTLLNTDGHHAVSFQRGDRIAQLVIQQVARVVLHEVESLPGSARAEGGFGSTGGHAAGGAAGGRAGTRASEGTDQPGNRQARSG